MIRIAIVDDEKIICDELNMLVRRYEQEHLVDFQISIYKNGENLLADIEESSPFDLILLDIELATINGVEVGCHIRNVNNDYNCQIIYISSKTSYAMSLFQIRPFDFLVKPVNEKNLFPCLDKYIELFSNEAYFEYKTRKIRKLIPVNNITHFESCGRKIIINCINEKYEYYGKLSDLTKDNNLGKFIMIHKSFYVNIFHISSYNYESIIIDGETELPVSKSNRKEVRRLILEYSSEKFKKR